MDENKLNDFVGEVLQDLGGAMSVAIVRLGARFGFYTTLAEKGPMTSSDLADSCSVDERYTREWLSQQAASGYLEYNAASNRFSLSPEQAMVLANEDSPVNLIPGFELASACIGNHDLVANAFITGKGVDWGDHGGCLFCAVGRFFRSGYLNFLVQNWLPALDGVVEKLERGAKVADLGCGHGFSTLLMAEAFPNSEFVGFDFHAGSIEHANAHAHEHPDINNARFEVATGKDFPGNDYDLIACFDCLHDMGDPAGCAAHVHQALKPDGTWLVVEPNAGDKLEDNLNPVGRLYYASSTLVCVPTSRAQEVGAGLGAQAGQAKLTEVINAGGFGSVKRATETPFNMILEARP
ncbi:MAG: class I SAM-dependent methyltransferase [Gammaproteobacteria bacterium]